ncbi:lysozyme family protein [Vagococcus entomophilus]|uniref:Transglycosylase SLT domain protein n=1 Tax=Vagococcus entomophilus TaxID=1160095 RepID=A0A430AJ68_9ENTE|nr:lysozyme family protein [Vagococcus entomophilus]RSU08150.1 transglycosylase SLT domain protein [Vagococcus entomophilus]
MIILFIVAGGWFGFKLKQRVDEVKKWQNTVATVAKKYDISDYQNIILAIILTESKGNHVDLMQSSESKYGTTDQVGTSEESIDNGVKFLAQAIKKAKSENVDIWTAIQSYNFGLSYIDFIQKNGKVSSVKLADQYSKSKLAPLLGNETGEKYRYWHLQSILYNGGYLYKDGGNMFYAEIVKWNLRIMKIINSIFH